MDLTDNQLYTLRHMLGINDPSARIPEPHRNYAAVDPGDPEFADLERLGAIRKYRSANGTTDYDWYECTDEGKLAAMRSFRTIQYPKKKRRYIKFLSISDCYQDLTFKEFLTSPEFAETRRLV